MTRNRKYGPRLALTGVFLCILLSSFLLPLQQEMNKRAFTFVTGEQVEIEVMALFDQNNVLRGYKSHVFSPVCGGRDCYPVELEFYWDVLGNFRKFELLPGKELTKLDHKAFTASDYRKLTGLLHNRAPLLSTTKKEDLVRQVSSDTIDGYTGATLESIKGEVIPGAVYSCYTLWHIAHGAVKDSIQAYSTRHLSDPLVLELSEPFNDEAARFLIKSFSEHDFEKYAHLVLSFIRSGKAHTPSELIKALPPVLLENCSFQDSLAILYPTLDYYAQKSLLQALDEKLCSEDLGLVLINHIESRSSQNTELIINIFCTKKPEPGKELTRLFIDRLLAKDVRLKEEQYRCMATMAQQHKISAAKIRSLRQMVRR